MFMIQLGAIQCIDQKTIENWLLHYITELHRAHQSEGRSLTLAWHVKSANFKICVITDLRNMEQVVRTIYERYSQNFVYT